MLVPVRKSWDIADVNELEMFYFNMRRFEEGNEGVNILLIDGDRGFYDYYRVEVRFFNIAYIGCAAYFDQDFVWRTATEEETREIQAYAYKIPDARVYCVEERYNPPKKFFFACASIEITLFYPDSLEGEFSRWGSKDR